VIGDEVVAAVIREAKAGRWKTNVAQGGKAKKVKLQPELASVAVKATKALGLEYAGVDVAQVPDEIYVLEVNCSPSFQALQKTTGVNIAEALIKHAEKRISQLATLKS